MKKKQICLIKWISTFFFFINPPEPNLTNKSQKFHSYLVMPYRPINFYFCDGNQKKKLIIEAGLTSIFLSESVNSEFLERIDQSQKYDSKLFVYQKSHSYPANPYLFLSDAEMIVKSCKTEHGFAYKTNPAINKYRRKKPRIRCEEGVI